MPPRLAPGSNEDWMERARASLALARGRGLEGVYLEDLGMDIPEAVDQATMLTRYAVETRYPGPYEAVTENEYQKAILSAEATLPWVKTTP